VADKIPPSVHFTPVLGRRPSCSICFLVDLSLLHKLRLLFIGYSLQLFAGSPELENIFEGEYTAKGILLVTQCCIIM
jgi:hypothetical protein